jgi:hypothetical protein
MDKPISVGDLVVVVRACCADTSLYLGKMFIAGPPSSEAKPRCRHCLTPTGNPIFTDEHWANFSSWRLKRIPPLSELEGQHSEDQLLFPEPI